MQSIEERVAEFVDEMKTRSKISFETSSNNAKVYECEVCKDDGLVVDRERNVARPCECLAKKRVNRVLKHSRISDEFRARTFDNFTTDGKDRRIVRALQLAKGYAAKFDVLRNGSRNSLGIVGAVGSGKTHLLCAIANDLLSRGIGVRYFNCVTGFREMFAKYDQGGQAVEEIRWELQTCDVLMLDDLAKGKIDKRTRRVDISKAVFEELYAIVDHRYFNRLPIIWSSELYLELTHDTALGEATASRLFEQSHIANITYANDEQRGRLNHRLRVVAG